MTDLEERYGRPRPVARVTALVLIVALVASGLGFLGWAVLFQSTPEVNSQLTAWEVLDEHTVTVTLDVARKNEFTEATCRLRALAEDHSVVGEVTVPVTDGPRTQAVRVDIRTERRATAVEPLGCTAPGQPQPR